MSSRGPMRSVLKSANLDHTLKTMGYPDLGVSLAPRLKSQSFKQTDLTRGIRAARKAGCEPTSAEVRPDGTIRLTFGSQVDEDPKNAFDRWKDKDADPA